jgi:hypothetical protein
VVDKGGRPRAFKTGQDFIDKLNEYLEKCEIEEKFPNVSGFCVFAEIHRRTYYTQEEIYPNEYLYARDILEDATLNSGNASDVLKIFYLKNRGGYKDNQYIEHSEKKKDPYEDLTEEELRKLADGE